MDEIIKALRAYAIEHYEEGGWDFLVECWEDSEIAKELEGITTFEEARKHMAEVLGTVDSYRRDIQGTAF
jgi:hypothetical protein